MNYGAANFTAEKTAQATEDIDISDIPELTRSDFQRARLRNWRMQENVISFRMDSDNAEWLKGRAAGDEKNWREDGCHGDINAALRFARERGFGCER